MRRSGAVITRAAFNRPQAETARRPASVSGSSTGNRALRIASVMP
ncbi:hypothetical protein NSERUTF1_1270 [Nocardia seriolae]|nr:hypothetical protein NSERUTF1_1270 [Nocardia seriolae]